MSRKWGIRMDGCGEPLERLIRDHVAHSNQSRPYTLVEIGSAGCVSLRSFADILSEARGSAPWRAVGLDLTPGKAWSLDIPEVERSFSSLPKQIFQVTPNIAPDVRTEAPLGMSLFLADDPRTFIGQTFMHDMDFVFVDASHGKSAGLDFLAIENKVSIGGVVVFHDYGEPEQGTDWQAHDREFISVRSYVHRLGLNQPSNGRRVGWRWVAEIKGSRHWGGDGNSCAVVQRTDEPLIVQPELSLD